MQATTQGWTNADEVPDWGAVGTEPPPPLEDGVYSATIVKATPEPTKGKDGEAPKPGIAIELRVDARHGSDEILKRKLFDKVVLTRDAAFRVKQLSEAASVDPPSSFQIDAVGEYCGTIVGCSVWLRAKRQTYNGKVNAKVDRYFSSEAQAGEAAAGSNGSSNGHSDEAIEAPRRKRRA